MSEQEEIVMELSPESATIAQAEAAAMPTTLSESAANLPIPWHAKPAPAKPILSEINTTLRTNSTEYELPIIQFRLTESSVRVEFVSCTRVQLYFERGGLHRCSHRLVGFCGSCGLTKGSS